MGFDPAEPRDDHGMWTSAPASFHQAESARLRAAGNAEQAATLAATDRIEGNKNFVLAAKHEDIGKLKVADPYAIWSAQDHLTEAARLKGVAAANGSNLVARQALKDAAKHEQTAQYKLPGDHAIANLPETRESGRTLTGRMATLDSREARNPLARTSAVDHAALDRKDTNSKIKPIESEALLSIGSLTSPQEWVNVRALHKHVNAVAAGEQAKGSKGGGLLPLVIKNGDSYIIADGNHRLIGQALAGKTIIKVRLKDYTAVPDKKGAKK